MLKLCGFHLSNYHNKVRIVLLEKGIPFEEDATCKPSQQEEFLRAHAHRQGAIRGARRRAAACRNPR
jgi:glutathione S-transferase